MNKTKWIVMAILVAIGAPGVAQAQEEEEAPTIVRLSFFMCDFTGDAGEQIQDELENRVIPVWREIVGEGTGIQDYGYIFHWWADEWNVGIYTIADSIQAVIDAEQEADRRLEERYGDGPSAFGEACPHHRDGFYTMGPSVGMGGAASGGN